MPQRLLSAGAVATSPALGMEMLAVAVAAGIDSDSILGTSNFRAKALTDAFIMTNGEMYGFSGDTSIDGQVAGRYFYGKILEAMDAGGSNPHAMFPDPCDPTYANTAASSLDIIMGMYTKFIIIDSERERLPVRENNIVEVRLAYVGHE